MKTASTNGSDNRAKRLSTFPLKPNGMDSAARMKLDSQSAGHDIMNDSAMIQTSKASLVNGLAR